MPPYLPPLPASGFYDPNGAYGSNVDYSTAPIVGGPGGYLSETPQAAFARRTPGFFGNNAYGAWLRGTGYNLARLGYQSAAATNPNLGFGYGPANQDYLAMMDPNFLWNQFARLSAPQRGLNNANYGGGRVQWSRGY